MWRSMVVWERQFRGVSPNKTRLDFHLNNKQVLQTHWVLVTHSSLASAWLNAIWNSLISSSKAWDLFLQQEYVCLQESCWMTSIASLIFLPVFGLFTSSQVQHYQKYTSYNKPYKWILLWCSLACTCVWCWAMRLINKLSIQYPKVVESKWDE